MALRVIPDLIAARRSTKNQASVPSVISVFSVLSDKA
jgi:hypothetical protein